MHKVTATIRYHGAATKAAIAPATAPATPTATPEPVAPTKTNARTTATALATTPATPKPLVPATANATKIAMMNAVAPATMTAPPAIRPATALAMTNATTPATTPATPNATAPAMTPATLNATPIIVLAAAGLRRISHAAPFPHSKPTIIPIAMPQSKSLCDKVNALSVKPNQPPGIGAKASANPNPQAIAGPQAPRQTATPKPARIAIVQLSNANKKRGRVAAHGAISQKGSAATAQSRARCVR